VDSNGQSLAYVYGHADPRDAAAAKALTLDEARRIVSRIASNIAKLRTPYSVTASLQRDHPNGASLGTIGGIGKALGFLNASTASGTGA
jgi:hypothetical protein